MSMLNRGRSNPPAKQPVVTSVQDEVKKAQDFANKDRKSVLKPKEQPVEQVKETAKKESKGPVVIKPVNKGPAGAEVRLAICVPCKDMLHSIFSHNLCSLLNYNHQKNIETRVFYNMGTLVCNQRAGLVKLAQEWSATHILWLDSDTSFPFYTAFKLLSHNQAIVAGNYSTRVLPYKTVAYKKQGDWESYLRHGTEIEPVKELIEVEGVGMGCMLTDIAVFDAVGKPWFNISYDERTDDYLGEDMDFCLRARERGYKVYIDDILSRQVSHLGTFAFNHDLVK
jgi:hypothetical protein